MTRSPYRGFHKFSILERLPWIFHVLFPLKEHGKDQEHDFHGLYGFLCCMGSFLFDIQNSSSRWPLVSHTLLICYLSLTQTMCLSKQTSAKVYQALSLRTSPEAIGISCIVSSLSESKIHGRFLDDARDGVGQQDQER